MIRPGDRIQVTGVRGTVLATVQSIATPAELPGLPAPAPPDVSQVREILEEFQVDQVAMISYEAADKTTLVFAALHVHNKWRDMRGQLLEISPAPT
jgi:hypothetical protein